MFPCLQEVIISRLFSKQKKINYLINIEKTFPIYSLHIFTHFMHFFKYHALTIQQTGLNAELSLFSDIFTVI